MFVDQNSDTICFLKVWAWWQGGVDGRRVTSECTAVSGTRGLRSPVTVGSVRFLHSSCSHSCIPIPQLDDFASFLYISGTLSCTFCGVRYLYSFITALRKCHG